MRLVVLTHGKQRSESGEDSIWPLPAIRAEFKITQKNVIFEGQMIPVCLSSIFK